MKFIEVRIFMIPQAESMTPQVSSSATRSVSEVTLEINPSNRSLTVIRKGKLLQVVKHLPAKIVTDSFADMATR
jgi:hypothetical protein